eukprot:scpid34513/ scgid11362/ 
MECIVQLFLIHAFIKLKIYSQVSRHGMTCRFKASELHTLVGHGLCRTRHASWCDISLSLARCRLQQVDLQPLCRKAWRFAAHDGEMVGQAPAQISFYVKPPLHDKP